MNDCVQNAMIKIFKELNKIEKTQLLNDPTRLSGLLFDMCGQNRKEIRAVLSAREEKIPEELLSINDKIIDEIIVGRLTQKLLENLPLTEEAAHWAVIIWALALGLNISSDVLQKKRPAYSKILATTEPIDLAPISTPDGPTLIVSRLGLGQYKTIGEAIKAAEPGTRILIRPGLYKENLYFDKPLEIIGDGTVDEIVLEGNPCFSIKTGQGKIKNMILRCTYQGPAIKVEGGTLEIDACKISNTYEDWPVWSSGGIRCVMIVNGSKSKVIIRDSDISYKSSKDIGLFIQGDNEVFIIGGTYQSVNIDCRGNVTCTKVKVKNLEAINKSAVNFSDCTFGTINLKGGCTPTFLDCQANATVVVTGHGTSGYFENCDFINKDGEGIIIDDCANPSLKNCTIHDTSKLNNGSTPRIYWHSGVLITENGEGTLEDCVISKNGNGIVIKRGGNPIIRSCRVNENEGYGILIIENGAGLIEDSDLTGNKGGAWKVEVGCPVRSSGNKEDNSPTPSQPEKAESRPTAMEEALREAMERAKKRRY